MQTIWKTITTFPNYDISSDGEVRSKKTQRLARHFYVQSSKAYKINLYCQGVMSQQTMHRLVATHFVENPNNYSFIGFKDGDRKNIKASNLVWVKSQKLCIPQS